MCYKVILWKKWRFQHFYVQHFGKPPVYDAIFVYIGQLKGLHNS
jgi:hypothetical protein